MKLITKIGEIEYQKKQTLPDLSEQVLASHTPWEMTG